jgi:hypothetical protein
MALILNGTDGLSDIDGTAATPAIRGTDTNTGIFFPAVDTIAFSEGGTEAMRIDSNGNVGIGTSSPSGRLNVRTAATTSATIARFSRSDAAVSADIFYDGTDGAISFGTTTNHPIAFDTNNTERMRIDSGGNLLVGVTATGTPSVGYVFNTNGVLQIGRASGAAQSTIVFYNGSTFVGEVRTSTTATTYATSSDYRLKENIAPMTGALATVSALKPVTYNWKSNGEASQGFIAHELQEVVPDCVTGEKDGVETVDEFDEDGKKIGTKEVPRYQGIDTSFLVATLTASIQELKAIVDAQAARITALESAKA